LGDPHDVLAGRDDLVVLQGVDDRMQLALLQV
jgi:hypothetical protein